MIHFHIKKKDDVYVAVCRTELDPPAWFCGEGDTEAEALGRCVISNREALNITFDIEENGIIERSTVYGQPR